MHPSNDKQRFEVTSVVIQFWLLIVLKAFISIDPISKEAMPNYQRRKDRQRSKKRKLHIVQNAREAQQAAKQLAILEVAYNTIEESRKDDDANQIVNNDDSSMSSNDFVADSFAPVHSSGRDDPSLSPATLPDPFHDDTSDDSFTPTPINEDEEEDVDLLGLPFDYVIGDASANDEYFLDGDDEQMGNEGTSSVPSTGSDNVVTHHSSSVDSDVPPVTRDESIEWTDLEVCTLELITFLDGSGATRGCFDELLTLLRRFRKKKVDISKAKGRKSFVESLQTKVKTPKPVLTLVRDRPVVHFRFMDCLRDLLHSSIFDDVDNLCVNKEPAERFQPFQPVTNADYAEVMANQWAIDTRAEIDDFDDNFDLLLGGIIYGDKTGTDVNQRYPLEPWMFSVLLLRRFAREDANAWRHLGYAPSMDLLESMTTEEKLQLYHEYMAVLLEDLKCACREKPIEWVNLGGTWKKMRLHIKLAIVSGDQLSQDNICARVSSNNGTAGRIHRGCGSSALHLANALNSDGILSQKCRPPPTAIMRRLNDLALLDAADDQTSSDVIEGILPTTGDNATAESRKQNKLTLELLDRVKRLAKGILYKTFSTHAIENAFDGIDFGANEHGLLIAAVDDDLHSNEAGVLHALSEVCFGGLVPKERNELEDIIRTKVLCCKSSILGAYPRGTVKRDFGKLTLMSHKEKVGSVFYLLLALHDQRGRHILQSAHKRQKAKYSSFPAKSKIQSSQKDIDNNNDGQEDSNHQESTTNRMAERSAAHKKNDPEQELPESSFPFKSDLLFGGTKSGDKDPFDRTDQSIQFVCMHLHLHGFGFLLDAELDAYQLDLLMVASWDILRQMKKKRYPSETAIRSLSVGTDFQRLFSVIDRDSAGRMDADIADCVVPATWKTSLPRDIPPKSITTTTNGHSHDEPITDHPSLPIHGCLPKHRRVKPKIKGSGNTGAVLSDMDTLAAYIELMLSYHAWCHYSHTLSPELQRDHDLVAFGKQMVVQYTDAILYRGDGGCDSATCKTHSQLHDASHYFGDPMQYNSETGERGLKTWAKGASKTALKHGNDKFTHSTSERVGERLLLNGAADRIRRKQAKLQPEKPPKKHRRKLPHFRFERTQTPHSAGERLLSMNRHGNVQKPNKESGSIPGRILHAIDVLEIQSQNRQPFIDIWCEADLQNGETVRCWQQYRGKEGSRYDWVMVNFNTEDGGEPEKYPAKLLALYDDQDGNFKALIHATEYKTDRAVEGPFGDTRLVTHYRLEFQQRNGEPKLYSVPIEDVLHCIVGYESCQYTEALAPRVPNATRQKEHTVMVIRRREEWANVFLDWSRELRARQQERVSIRNRNRLDF